MGRKTQPLNLIINNGRTHLTKQQIEARRKHEINPNKDKIVCPDWLGEIAKDEWHKIVEDLKELDIITNLDVSALAVYCDAYENYVKATEQVQKLGLVVKHTNKAGASNVVTNPYVLIANKYAELMKKYLIEFGLTPSSRAAIAKKGAEADEPSELDKMFGEV